MIWWIAGAAIAGLFVATALIGKAHRGGFRAGLAAGFEAGQKEGARVGIHVALEHMARAHGNEVLTGLAREALDELNGRGRPN